MPILLSLLLSTLLALAPLQTNWDVLYTQTMGHLVHLRGPETSCTGIVVATNRVLGAAHCISEETLLAEGYTLQLEVVDVGHDLALWSGLLLRRPIEIRDIEVSQGEEVLLVGFGPKGPAPYRGKAVGLYGGYIVAVPSVEHGYSGGAMVDAEGRLGGVVVRINPVTDATYVVPLASVLPFLRSSLQVAAR